MKTMKDNKHGKCAMLDSVCLKTTSAIRATALILAFGVGMFVMEAAASVQEGILNKVIRVPHAEDLPTFSEKTARLVGSTDTSKKRLEIFGVSMDDVIEVPSKEELEKKISSAIAIDRLKFLTTVCGVLNKVRGKDADTQYMILKGMGDEFQNQWGIEALRLHALQVLRVPPEKLFTSEYFEIGNDENLLPAKREEEQKSFRLKLLKEGVSEESIRSDEVTKDDLKPGFEEALETHFVWKDVNEFVARQKEALSSFVESKGLKFDGDTFPRSLKSWQVRENTFSNIDAYAYGDYGDLQGIVWKASQQMSERAKNLRMECYWLQSKGSRIAKPFYIHALLLGMGDKEERFERICKALERKYGNDLIQTMYQPQGEELVAQYVMNGDAIKILAELGSVKIFIVNNEIVGKFHEAAEERKRQEKLERDEEQKERDAELDAI